MIGTGVLPSKAPQLVDAVLAELELLAANGPSESELAKARAIVKGTSALDREDAVALARLSAFELRHRGFVRTRAERDQLADEVTFDEVVEAARRYLDPANLRCGLVGPAGVAEQIADASNLPSSQWRVIEG